MIKNKKRSTANIIINSLKQVVTTCPLLLFISVLFGGVHGLTFGFNVYFVEKFFNAMSSLANHTGTFDNAIKFTIIYGLALLFCRVCNAYSNYFGGDVLTSRVNGKLYERLNLKAGKLSMISFENPTYLDDIKRANDGVEAINDIAGTMIDTVFFYGPYFVFMGVYYFKIYPLLSVALLMAGIPPIISQIFKIKYFSEFADKQGPIKREYEYYENCMCDREYYKETRILGIYQYFKGIYKNVLGLYNKEYIKAEKKALMVAVVSDVLSLVGYILIIILNIRLVLAGKINIGEFSAVFVASGEMISIVMEVVNYRLSDISKQSGFAANYLNFLDMPEKGGEDIEIDKAPELSLENVTFTYPAATSPSINNLNLHIKSGETIAIVGENGAGKSTIVKLIMGLFEPDEGKVLINGNDTKKISTKSMFKNTSAVFQNFQKYKMTLADNVSISDLNSIEPNDSDIYEAIKKADVDANSKSFTDGLDTMLSREFDGTDLSGGQWQSVAIARAFYRKHNMIVLDEPTAAIDPVMETKIYHKFAQMSKGKTSIVVTHRLGSAKIADRIVVLDKGQVCEVGTHEELMNNKGKYFEMYRAQSQWYES